MLKALSWFGFIAAADAIKVQLLEQTQAQVHFNCETDHVLMYTLGKTGSTSLQKSVQDYCNWADEDFPYIETMKTEYPRAMKVHRMHDVAADYLSKLPPSSTVWIITLVRNPFDRIFSAYFQSHWCEYVSRNSTLVHGDLTATKSRATEDLHAMLSHGQNDYFRFWENTTGIPMRKSEFDQTKKHIFLHKVQKSLTVNAILLRAEDIDDWGSILAPYMPGMRMETRNEADEKIYADFYHQIKQSFIFSDEEIKDIMNNAPELQFYSPEEKAAMIPSLESEATSLLRVETRRASALCYCSCR
jgi:hypothetical protein